MHFHKPRKEKLPLARFFLVNAHPKTLKDERNVYKILQSSIGVFGEMPYTSFAAIVHTPETVNPMSRDVVFPHISGRMVRDSVEGVESVLNEKYDHEAEHFRQSGRKSTHPPAFLVPEKLVIVMGDMEFLSFHIELYLEKRAGLGDQTFDYMRMVMGTHPWPAGKTGKKNCFVDAIIDDKIIDKVFPQRFYAGNFNAYAERSGLSRRSDEELIRHLNTFPDDISRGV